MQEIRFNFVKILKPLSTASKSPPVPPPPPFPLFHKSSGFCPLQPHSNPRPFPASPGASALILHLLRECHPATGHEWGVRNGPRGEAHWREPGGEGGRDLPFKNKAATLPHPASTFRACLLPALLQPPAILGKATFCFSSPAPQASIQRAVLLGGCGRLSAFQG